MLVSEPIDDDTGQWNRQKVHILFAPSTRCEILAIPLNALHRRDELEWKENRARRFSVKDAYHVAIRLSHQDGAEHSNARIDGKVWKTIWALKVPPKVRNFIWRVCSNILPTKENLHSRRVKMEPRCDICYQQPESTSHLLWECPMARNVWARVQKCSNQMAAKVYHGSHYWYSGGLSAPCSIPERHSSRTIRSLAVLLVSVR
uniref:Reverse transcriptase zinc-binding domain-containing protein n=1 Tax=Quercus lobata TaxID=97700 RepID=A0A7N2MJI0_QUELO